MSKRLTSPLLDDPGLILGLCSKRAPRTFGFTTPSAAGDAKRDEIIRYAGEGHLMTIGATGSGKTAGPAISNALTHPGQLVVTECSGYIFDATAEARKAMGQEVHLLDLREMNPASGAFNPIDAAKFCGGDSGVISRSLAAAAVTRSKHEEVFWSNWGETMISSGLALKLETCPPQEHTFAALFDLFNSDDVTYSLAVQLDTFKNLSRAAHAGIAGYLQLSERETRPSVLGSTQ
jgi:type IV secretion system protein VirD4